MEVFLSWSGSRSRAVAEALRNWLPLVIQALEPWISPDTGKGERWASEISLRLERARVGILCLTADNLTAPWLLFEAGAISKQKDSRPCTFLLDVKPSDVEQPLGQFQHTIFEKADILKLVRGLNSDLSKANGSPLKDEVLNSAFEKFWPELEAALVAVVQTKISTKPVERTQTEKLDEALDLLRALSRRAPDPDAWALLAALIARRGDAPVPTNYLRDLLRSETKPVEDSLGLLGTSFTVTKGSHPIITHHTPKSYPGGKPVSAAPPPQKKK